MRNEKYPTPSDQIFQKIIFTCFSKKQINLLLNLKQNEKLFFMIQVN